MSMDAVLNQIDSDLDQSLERLFALLRIESISTDPAYAKPCIEAADWLVAQLQEIGLDASRRDTLGHPMVVAHGGEGGPHLLFYGHYDVQPVDPLDLWKAPPFAPAIQDTAKGQVIVARGAGDDKGQLMTFVEALRAWKAVHGGFPMRITVLFEGEEETGSPSLLPFLRENADELRADLALVCDTGMWNRDTPAIVTMLRGLASEEVTIQAADRDLHSGMYGGPAMNPIRILTRLLADLHDPSGRVTLPGFYEGVPDLAPDIKAQWDALDFDTAGFLGDVGLTTPAGEQDYSALEQIWSRPTCEVNGIWGGYTGKGFKTVLPSEAHAKISFRLVGDQDPVRILETFRSYITNNLPPDCSATFARKEPAGATVLPVDTPAFTRAHAALGEEWPNPAVFAGCGGSIPIVGHFKEILGMDSMLIGFGLEDDAIHSPNEKYNLSSFHKGTRSWARVIAALQGDE
ncbi:MAG: M20/M25/M40 family metallo-hydrolase [Pseudomonadota bacterium]